MKIGRISNIQAAMLAITSLTIVGHLILLTLVISHSLRDGWIAAIIGTVLGLIGIIALVKLAQEFPGQSLVQLLFSHFSWVGKIAGSLYLIYFYLMAALGTRLFIESYKLIMKETPMWAFAALIISLTAYIVYLGLETLGRVNQIMLPTLVVIAIAVVFLTMGEHKDYSNLLPIMGNGIYPVAKGSITVMGWFGGFVIIGMVMPYITRPDKLVKTGIWTAVITLVFFLGPITGPIALFGVEQAKEMAFPTFSEVRYIVAGTVINRFDAIAVLFWTIGLMVHISLFFYGLSLGVAQVFKLKAHQPLVIPLGWLIGIGSLLFANNFTELTDFLFKSYIPLNLLMGVGLPLLFLIWGKVKKDR